MASKTWDIWLRDAAGIDRPHRIEVTRGGWFGPRAIRVDGRRLPPAEVTSHTDRLRTHSDDLFTLEGHACLLQTSFDGFGVTTDLSVDGVSVVTGKPTRQRAWGEPGPERHLVRALVAVPAIALAVGGWALVRDFAGVGHALPSGLLGSIIHSVPFVLGGLGALLMVGALVRGGPARWQRVLGVGLVEAVVVLSAGAGSAFLPLETPSGSMPPSPVAAPATATPVSGGQAVAPVTVSGKEAYALAQTLLNTRKFSEAIVQMDKAIAAEPKNATYLVTRAVAYLSVERRDPAMNDLNAALALNPREPLAHALRGSIYAYLGRHDQALREYDAELVISPNSVETWYVRASTQLALQDWKGCVESATKAILLKPDYADAFWVRSLARNNLNENPAALDDVTRAIVLNPVNWQYYSLRGAIYVAMQDNPKAVVDFEKMLTLSPPADARAQAEQILALIKPKTPT